MLNITGQRCYRTTDPGDVRNHHRLFSLAQLHCATSTLSDQRKLPACLDKLIDEPWTCENSLAVARWLLVQEQKQAEEVSA
jgi:hypothetical protein